MGVALIVTVSLIIVPLLSLLVLAATKHQRQQRTAGAEQRKLPPSPPGALPLLGHIHLLGRLPHRGLRSLSTSHGPVMLLRLGPHPTVVASSAAAADEALRTRDASFASRPRLPMVDRLVYGSRDLSFARYGDYWRQARRVCVLHLLSHRRVRAFRRAREREAAALVARVRRDGAAAVVNLSDALVSYAKAVVARAAFGDGDYVVDGDRGGDKLRRVVTDLQQLIMATPVREIAPWLGWVDTLTGLEAKAKRTFEAMDGLLDRMIADHRARRRQDGHRRRVEDDDDRDFVDVLLDVNEMENDTGLRLDMDNIKGLIMVHYACFMCLAYHDSSAYLYKFLLKLSLVHGEKELQDMFVAGTDTSYTVLEWAMAELINHPDQMRKLQEEVRGAITGGHVTEDHLDGMPYLKGVISETMRLHAPVPLLLPRETTEDTELLGYHIPAGTRVLINAWAIGRDAATWDHAEEFMPERFAGAATMDYTKVGQDMRFLAFGAGRRGCPGVGFAAPSVELALANMVYHFDWESTTTSHGRRKEGPPVLEMSEAFGLTVRRKEPLLLVAKPWSG
ncbi:hypothetical protein HU200_014821 [Digitaria exilis]|uniref:Cytochrome P450 n=1 Tax=Digitaria exilis TaxID=1010633 RepID=A0A835FB38_9POAL|nr:hypothetical protein HU200_014821 [Digitaria exilis]CAB3471647.1 unnamed protein product [Digitaria exilis]